jgi:hypothetical protein
VKRLPIVEIEWVDAYNLPTGWHLIEDVLADADEIVTGRSAGYLVGETERAIVISAGLNAEGDQVTGGIVVIPRVAVLSCRVIYDPGVAETSAGPPHKIPQPAVARAADGGEGGAAAEESEPGTGSAPNHVEPEVRDRGDRVQ